MTHGSRQCTVGERLSNPGRRLANICSPYTTLSHATPTLVNVKIVERKLTVAFYAVEPMPAFDGLKSFAQGAYPIAEVLDTVRGLDPAADTYRVSDKLFGSETLCVLHEDGPQSILGAYTRDNLAQALTEYKGEITELMLREGEALVDASYVAFFPLDVVGVVRTSMKSPGFARIGQWLTVQGRYSCGLVSLPDPDTMAQLDREPTRLHRFTLRVRRNVLPQVQASSPRVAEVLRAAASLNDASDQIGIDQRVFAGQEQARWSRLVRQQIQELLAVLPDCEEATVQVSGQRHVINLRRAQVRCQVRILLEGTKRVGPQEAAKVLFEAYELEQNSIRRAIDVVRRPPGESAASTT